MKNREELEQMARTLGGIVIWNVLPGSASAQAEIGYGDILLSVNGLETRTIDDYIKARRLRENGATVQIFREGRALTVELEFGKPTSIQQAVQLIVNAELTPPPPLKAKEPVMS